MNAAPLMDQLRAQGKVVAGDRIIIAKVGVNRSYSPHSWDSLAGVA
jgi:hypothetical protein